MKHKFTINYAVFDLRLTWLVFVCLLANWGILLVVRVGGPASGYSLWHYEHWSPDLFSETKFIVTVSWKQAWHTLTHPDPATGRGGRCAITVKANGRLSCQIYNAEMNFGLEWPIRRRHHRTCCDGFGSCLASAGTTGTNGRWILVTGYWSRLVYLHHEM